MFPRSDRGCLRRLSGVLCFQKVIAAAWKLFAQVMRPIDFHPWVPGGVDGRFRLSATYLFERSG